MIIQIIKNHHHFNQKVCEYSMNKKIYQIYYLINVIFIQSNVLTMILGQDIPFVYPNREWNPFIGVIWVMCLFHVIMFVHMSYITPRNLVICNQSLCNWHATSCRLQLFWSYLQLTCK